MKGILVIVLCVLAAVFVYADSTEIISQIDELAAHFASSNEDVQQPIGVLPFKSIGKSVEKGQIGELVTTLLIDGLINKAGCGW
ncbi:hypothetical protein KAU32_10245 [bacterium]|nr:hypothetical protein [bacterium]